MRSIIGYKRAMNLIETIVYLIIFGWIFIKKWGEISYKLEDIQLIYRGEGNKSKIYKIEINVKENAPKAKITIFVENSSYFNVIKNGIKRLLLFMKGF